MSRSPLDFVRQQDLTGSEPIAGQGLYAALTFSTSSHRRRRTGRHPASESGGVLGTCVVVEPSVPTHNPFDALYNRLIAHPPHLRPLRVAREPRRFAQGLAATFALAIGAAPLPGGASFAWCSRAAQRSHCSRALRKILRGIVRLSLLRSRVLTKQHPVSPGSHQRRTAEPARSNTTGRMRGSRNRHLSL